MTKGKESISRKSFLRLAGMATVGTAVATTVGCSPKGGASGYGLDTGPIEFTKETDVLIIGTGGAGFFAAYAPTKAGLSTIMVEKSASYGGDTMISAGLMPINGTVAQEQQGIVDKSAEEVIEIYKDNINAHRLPEFLKMRIRNYVRVANIWTEEMGVEWTEFDPGYTKHFHVAAPGMGNQHAILDPLYKTVVANGAEVLFETKAISLIVDEDDKPVGLRTLDTITGEYIDIKAKKICIASGGFACNQEMIATYLPNWASARMITYTSMGEGILMAVPLGAGLEDMDSYTTMTMDNDKISCASFYGPMIHVNPEGKRFCNEFKQHKVGQFIHDSQWTHLWTIFDEQLLNGADHIKYAVTNVINEEGRTVKADTIEELAELMFVPPAALAETMKNYNEMALAGEDTEFEKTVDQFLLPLSGPFYAAITRPIRYKTNGGLRIDMNSQVTNDADTPITNLFAAGSVTGICSPNVHDVCGCGLHAGEMMVKQLEEEA